jgi:hypothetical protein
MSAATAAFSKNSCTAASATSRVGSRRESGFDTEHYARRAQNNPMPSETLASDWGVGVFEGTSAITVRHTSAYPPLAVSASQNRSRAACWSGLPNLKLPTCTRYHVPQLGKIFVCISCTRGRGFDFWVSYLGN